MPERKDVDQIRFFIIAIEGDIPRLAKRDDQFAQRGMVLNGASNQWRYLKSEKRLFDDPTRPCGGLGGMTAQEHAAPPDAGSRPLCDG